MRRDTMIMHPGPMNPGIEIDPEVAMAPQSVIESQVTNGVAIRMALLYTLGEAYAFGVIWSFVFKTLAMVILRFKDKSPREYEVPLNIRMRLPRRQPPVKQAETAIALCRDCTPGRLFSTFATMRPGHFVSLRMTCSWKTSARSSMSIAARAPPSARSG